MRKKVHMNICLISSGYRQSPIHWPPWYSDLNVLDYCLLGWMQNEICCPHKEKWRSTQTNNTRSSNRICKVFWCRRWDFQTFVVNWINLLFLCKKNLSFKHLIRIIMKLTVSNFCLFSNIHSGFFIGRFQVSFIIQRMHN